LRRVGRIKPPNSGTTIQSCSRLTLLAVDSRFTHEHDTYLKIMLFKKKIPFQEYCTASTKAAFEHTDEATGEAFRRSCGDSFFSAAEPQLYLNHLRAVWACAKKRTQVKRDMERKSNYEYTCDPIQEDPKEV
jgi:hypothetical protein